MAEMNSRSIGKKRKECVMKMKFWKRFCCISAACAAMMTACVMPAFAGQWEQTVDGDWKYGEDGTYFTGWQKVDNVWYYLNPETELWVEKPQLNDESVCRLLENAVNRAGWYHNEDKEMYYQIDSSDKYQYTVSLMVSTEPYFSTGTLNTFDVSKKTGLAKSESTKWTLDLYE